MNGQCSFYKNEFMRLLLFSFFFLILSSVQAQKLSTEKDKFLKQLPKIVESESFLNFVKRDFTKFINSSKLNSQEYTRFVEACNKMLKKSYSSDDLMHYVYAIYYAKTNSFTSSFTSQWHSYYDSYLMESEVAELRSFIHFSEGLFKHRSFYKESDYRWVLDGGELIWENEESLRLVVKNTNLKCMIYQSGPRDSVVVYNTSGYFDVSKKVWNARGGKVTWEKVGFPKNETYAEIRGYSVRAKDTKIKIDTVELTTPYFDKPILGKLEDKTIFNLKEGESSPIFNSFEKRLIIKDLRDQIDYDGGFTLEGANFIGRGVENNLAKLTLNYNENKLFELRSLNFVMTPQQIISRNANISMFYENGDSLYTKGALVYWNEKQKELKITADKKGTNPVPFVDNYFKVFVDAPVLSWKLNTPFPMYTFEVGTAQSQRYAHIESWNYFDERIFDKFSGMGNINPLMAIAELSIREDSYNLPVGMVASQLRKTIGQCKSQLIDISSMGFIQYSSNSSHVIVEQKLINYALSKKGEKDYDELRFVTDLRPKKFSYSDQEVQNDPYLKKLKKEYDQISYRRKQTPCYAYIDVNKSEIVMNEIEKVNFSSKQRTFLFPDSSFVRLLKNRDIIFSGWLMSGKLISHNIGSTFDYDEFMISIDTSDEAYLSVNPLSQRDGRGPIDMVSSFKGFNGKLFIDLKDSKSGRNGANKQYPYIDIKDSLKIYYNGETTVNGSYDSTRFYYALDPFVLDSLDNLDEKSLRLSGVLKSDGIFPDLNEPLRIMNDYSFGFVTSAPEEGYPFYETESRYQNKIVLSNNGLQGAGTINFMNAEAVSKKLTFLPDSTIGLAQFYNEKDSLDIQYPEVAARISEISFKPRMKVLTVKSHRDNYISMFGNQSYLKGSLTFSEDGLEGSGSIDLLDASMFADKYTFSANEIFSDSSSFNLRNRFAKMGENPLAIQSDGLKSYISFESRIGEFNSSGTKRIKFPSNNYYCQMDKFLWQMDGESIDFEKEKDSETKFESSAGIVQNNFFSMDEKQDSLQFKSISAQYDLKNETINCFKVDFLELGDAFVFPSGKKLRIQKDAVIDTFYNATIIANRITKIHQFSDVTVSVEGRNQFFGNGYYLYYDRDSALTKINIGKIYFDKTQTIASTDIKEEAKFKLSSKFDYFGDFKVSSKNDGVICDGYARVNHLCDFNKSWMKFSDTISAENVQIPIEEFPTNKNEAPLAAGFLWKDSESQDSLVIYPTFLSKKESEMDNFLFSAYGTLEYNYNNEEFRLSNNYQDDNYTYAKTSLILNEKTCSLEGKGPIDLGINFAPVELTSFGDIKFDNSNGITSLDLFAKLDIPLPKNISNYFGGVMQQSDSLEEYTFSKTTQERLTDIFSLLSKSEDKAEKLFKDYDEDKLKKAPTFLNQSYVFPELHLEFYMNKKVSGRDAVSGLMTKYSRTPVFSINDKIVLKRIPMKLLFLNSNSNENVQGFEIEIKDEDSDLNYSFKFIKEKKNGKLFINSEDKDYMNTILEIKEDKRKSKNFSFTNGDEGQMYEMMILKKIK